MHLAHSKADHEAKLATALAKLGAARREKLSKEDFTVFADGLREFPIETVIRVCDELGRIAPDEFQPRFPPLYVIREHCHTAVAAGKAKLAMLTAPKPEPASPERLQRFLDDVKALASRKAMAGERAE